MRLKFFITIMLFASSFLGCSQQRDTLESIIGREIIIDDGFAGQSITLVKEIDKYYVIRKYFGSGVPVIGTVKYKADILSNYKLHFSEIIEYEGIQPEMTKKFDLLIDENNTVKLFLNGLLLDISFYN